MAESHLIFSLPVGWLSLFVLYCLQVIPKQFKHPPDDGHKVEILIIGGAGYIGSHVIPQLVEGKQQ